MHIFIYVYTYIYIEKATASAADLWDPRNGCLDAWMLGCLDACLCARLVADVAPIWVALWRPWVTCGVTWDGPCKLLRALGLDWLRQATQLSHLAFLCGREHPFRQICWILGQNLGILWQPVADWARTLAPCGSLWRTVATE